MSLPIGMALYTRIPWQEWGNEGKKQHNLHMNCVEINFHVCIYTMKINLNLIALVMYIIPHSSLIVIDFNACVSSYSHSAAHTVNCTAHNPACMCFRM